MAFKFLHTSDLHFGAGRRLTPKSLDYLERHKSILRLMLKMAVKEKVDFILVSGDIFQDAGTTVEEILAAYDIFSQMGEIATTIVTAGNHDELSVGEFQTAWLRMLSIPNVYFVDKPQVIKLPQTSILAMPWTGLKEQEQFDQLIAVNLKSEVEIAMLHECFLGVTLDSGLTAKGGVKIPDIPQIRYWCLGDIHKYQRCQLPHAWYSGAPMQYNFGDQLPKGFIMVDVDNEKNYVPRFVNLPSPIELHNITSLDQIPSDSPHWYKLRIDAASMPKHVPPQVKSTEPVPRKIELPKPVFDIEEKTEQTGYQAVDFTEGVDQVLLENGFEAEEIALTKKEILNVINY